MSVVSVLDPQAGRALFDVCCALAWADGELVEPELRAIRGLAIALGQPDLISGTSDAVAQRAVLPTSWRLARLEPRARLLICSAAAWIALADGAVDALEADALEELRERAELDVATARFARSHAAWATSAFARDAPHRAATRLIVECARRAELLWACRASGLAA